MLFSAGYLLSRWLLHPSLPVHSPVPDQGGLVQIWPYSEGSTEHWLYRWTPPVSRASQFFIHAHHLAHIPPIYPTTCKFSCALHSFCLRISGSVFESFKLEIRMHPWIFSTVVTLVKLLMFMGHVELASFVHSSLAFTECQRQETGN